MDWRERFLIRNLVVKSGVGQQDKIQEQLRLAEVQFGDLLIARSEGY